MGWENYLTQLRTKPEAERQKILWWVLGLCMLVVLGIWFVTWHSADMAGQGSGNWWQEFLDLKLKIITGWQTLTKTK